MNNNLNFKVLARNAVNGDWEGWHFPTVEDADRFAEQQARRTGDEAYVLKLLGTWRTPVEWVSADDD